MMVLRTRHLSEKMLSSNQSQKLPPRPARERLEVERMTMMTLTVVL